jgi:hypothetical protein
VLEVVPDPRRPKAVAVIRQNLDVFWRGQAKLTELQEAIRRLNDTKQTLDLYESRLEKWDGASADSLVARTGRLKAAADSLLDRMRLPDGPGIRADTTITSRLGGAIGEATGTPYAPSVGRVQQLDRAVARADEVLRAVESFYATEVPSYREALRAAGFDPLGGG